MNIAYVYSNCSQQKYKELVESKGMMILQQAQKYHQLLLEGLSGNDVNVSAYSCLPVNRKLTNKIFFKSESETVNNIKYYYMPFINLPIARSIFVFISSFISIIDFCLKNRNGIVVSDILNISVSSGALLATKLMRKKIIGIVTDVPGHLVDKTYNSFSFAQKINQFLLFRFDSYLFLTEQMNLTINKKFKPFIVIEGHVDRKMQDKENNYEDKDQNFICLYAGSIKKIYGIKNLTEAFLSIKNAELHIYGNGDYEEELRSIAKENNNIKYFGIKPNEYIVDAQIKATLLINPRPTNEEYTKYSFPSKNMEYMASGTPVLTTKLPGMPREYYDYVYMIEDESTSGIKAALLDIISRSRKELHGKGIRAKEFVLSNKNNIIQAKKLINLMEGLNK